MIRKVPYNLTTGKPGRQIAVNDDFIAYAIAWSMAPSDIVAVLEECEPPKPCCKNGKVNISCNPHLPPLPAPWNSK